MSISLHNPYPDETMWRLFLPKESPLQYLTYGLMTESIINKVKKIRKRKRIHRLMFLIHKINNHNLNKLYREIYVEAEKLKTFKAMDWYKRGSKKVDRYRFFKSNNIPLIYLEDALNKQIKGIFKFKAGDLIKTDHSIPDYGIVVKTKNNTVYYNLVKSIFIDAQYQPIWHIYDSGIFGYFMQNVSAWRCTKIGKESNKIRRDRFEYYSGIQRRKKYWSENNVLKHIIAPEKWLDMTIDVFAGEIPNDLWIYSQEEKDIWKIIKNQVNKHPPTQ